MESREYTHTHTTNRRHTFCVHYLPSWAPFGHQSNGNTDPTHDYPLGHQNPVCVCMCVSCVFVCLCLCMHVRELCVCVCICMFECLCLCMHVRGLCVCVCICMFVCLCLCMLCVSCVCVARLWVYVCCKEKEGLTSHLSMLMYTHLKCANEDLRLVLYVFVFNCAWKYMCMLYTKERVYVCASLCVSVRVVYV